MRASFIRVSPFSLVVLLAFAGCRGEPRPDCHPVQGEVRLDNRPLSEAFVVFHPLSESKLPAPRPQGYCDAAGKFALSTFENGDGAPAGEYAVTVELREPRQVGEEVVRDGRNLLPFRYAKPETSGLRYTVVAGANSPALLELKSR